ncbi:DHH family phosphoesterase [Tissierella creatinophila]|uniref:Cyclic-di-AMP phosphodiesterase n=1 Tax=Tissierella creatinophila DSM 6911 TaxID=1123403 RepID=A0A1U7M892_TISCR|nr:DHH family phosphoesterase [Tissierella creatinophila]OLS03429.1 bifunctional oligoribonuclease and PAP phosphatase NrnA [Tissierella creatinophila DSM 6911]
MNDLFQWHDNKIQMIISAIFVVIIAIFKPVLGLIAAIAFSYIVYLNFISARDNNKRIDKYVEDLSEDFESATKHAIFNMPFPLVMINEMGSIIWYNTPFLDMIVEEEILNERIYDLMPKVALKDVLSHKEKEPIQVNYDDKDYLVYPNFVNSKGKSNSNGKIIMLYWVENTEHIKLINKYNDEITVIMLAYIDNYDDVRNTTPDINRPLLLAEIDKTISQYFSNYDALVRKYEDDKYMIIIDNKDFKSIKNKKFDVLDEMRELQFGNTIPITLSMGISENGNDFVTRFRNARAAVDISLGRGGDQAVINKGGNFEFYGGKSKAVEKRNKVRARVIAYALRQLIEQSSTVFIMGHKNPDMDAIGSGIGVLRGVKNREKQGYLVLTEENPSIKNLLQKLKVEQPELLDSIITPTRAKEIIDKDSLMILVDNHKPSFTESPELVDLAQKIVIIDHHRRGAEFVEDPVLTYLEPYASSASELVTEVLTYMSDNINLTKFEAEALLAGITVDTKNFSSQTGVRTFEAASTLKRAGADTTNVRQLFRDDFDTFIHRADVIRESKIFFEKIAISILDKELENGILIAAQSANELLDINGVEASFVLTPASDRIHISGRSLGNISAQIILEKLGGGGHLTSAGTQIMGVSMEKAKEMLIEAIDKYLKEGEE